MISVYADGSSHARGGKPGGWAWVISRDGEALAASYGGLPKTTNNVMELTGAINGLRALKDLINYGTIESTELAELVSDSQYTLGMASGAWKATKNNELVAELQMLVAEIKPRLRWVKGHAGETWNERCDSLAKRGKEEQVARLDQRQSP